MRLTISHQTHYAYDRPIEYALQKVRLTPVTTSCQEVVQWQTTVEGGRTELDFDDHHGNRVMLVSLEPGAQEMVVHSRGEVETTDMAGISGKHDGKLPLWCYIRDTPLTLAGTRVEQLVARLGDRPVDQTARLHALAQAVAGAVRYEPGTTDATTNAEDALSAGHGVCQDHAHIFASAARLMGIPARYVSGYLMMNDRVAQDAGHAWAEAHIDGLGWVGFDVSNGISPDERYVRLATGLDYKEAAPVSGVTMGENAESMTVTVQVQQ